jgi:hypothetical protein
MHSGSMFYLLLPLLLLPVKPYPHHAQSLTSSSNCTAFTACLQDDGMWLLQPAKGRTAIRKVWRDWLRSVPDYQIEPVQLAVEAATSDVFVLWRASGQAKLSVIPQRPTTNKPFEHYGVTRCAEDGGGIQ